MLREIKETLKTVKEIKEILIGKEEMTDLEKQYKEYKYFADIRGQKLLAEKGLLDEYNAFMNECEETLFGDNRELGLPKPSPQLEAFKNKFKKFF